jgi:tetratricopeptide (TPR) repeat protein
MNAHATLISLPYSTLPPPVAETPDDRRARALDALFATGHWLLSEGRVHDAASVFRGMAVLSPGDERPWLALGACHEALKQADLALDVYAAGQTLTTPAVRSRLARARVLLQLGREEEAEDARASAEVVAEAIGDPTLIALVAEERGNP